MSIASDARFWDRSSRGYARYRIADPDGYERTLERTRGHLRPGDGVLELGCGTGTTALRLADGVRSYRATDISGGMVAIAEEKLAVESIPSLSFRSATAEELVHEESRFDAVLGFNYLHLVRDVPGTLRCIHILLKPGGLFISKTPCLGDMNPLIRLLALPAMRAIGKAPHVSSLGASALERLIIDAGFDVLVRESHASKGKDQRPYIVARKR
jgi:ubiquinone/menaquinone biosynthesis C-methylase UbiE